MHKVSFSAQVEPIIKACLAHSAFPHVHFFNMMTNNKCQPITEITVHQPKSGEQLFMAFVYHAKAAQCNLNSDFGLGLDSFIPEIIVIKIPLWIYLSYLCILIQFV